MDESQTNCGIFDSHNWIHAIPTTRLGQKINCTLQINFHQPTETTRQSKLYTNYLSLKCTLLHEYRQFIVKTTHDNLVNFIVDPRFNRIKI